MSVRIEVERLKGIKLNEGDVLLVQLPEYTKPEIIKFVGSVFDRVFPNNKILTTTMNVKFQIIAAEHAKDIKK